MTIKTVAAKTTYFSGGKRGVILMHAYTGSPNDVRLLGRYLNNNGYSVLMPMLTGHGTSRPEDILEARVVDWQRDLKESIAFMEKQGFLEVAIFGLSLGGIFAMSAIEDYPDYIIGGGPFCSPLVPESKTNIMPTFIGYAESIMVSTAVNEAEIKKRLPLIKEQLTDQLQEIQQLTQEIFAKLATIKQPTLLVQAARDRMIDPQDVYIMEKELTASASQVKWYPRSGHVITIGMERQQLQEDVLSFLNTLPWQNN